MFVFDLQQNTLRAELHAECRDLRVLDEPLCWMKEKRKRSARSEKTVNSDVNLVVAQIFYSLLFMYNHVYGYVFHLPAASSRLSKKLEGHEATNN